MAFLKDIQDRIILGRWRFLNLQNLISDNTRSIGIDENGILGIIDAGTEEITIEDVTGLQDALDEKADNSDIPDVSGFATTTELTNGLAGKADTVHTHTQSQITGLIDDLADKLTANQGDPVSDAVDGTDIVQQFNALLQSLRQAGIINT